MLFNKLKFFLSIFLALISTQSYALICSDYGDFKEYGGHYYTSTIKRMPFTDAKIFAQNSGGYLAIPNTQAENDFITSLVRGGQYAWIGVYDPNYTSNYCYGTGCVYDDSRFKTIKNGALTYKKWASAQPDNLLRSYDIVDGVEKVSPLGEHWVALASPSGEWADFGNHFDEYNNPVQHYAVYEFDTMPECYTAPSTVTDQIEGIKCNTKVYDDKLDLLIDGQTFDCQQDQYGTDFCPSALAACSSTWDYDEGWSESHIGTHTETYEKVRIWTGRIGDNYWGGSCNLYSASAYFNITDLDKVIEFKLKRAKFDDWIKITVNGTVVRVGPYGGDRLQVVYGQGHYTSQSACNAAGEAYCNFTKVQYTSSNTGRCELSTSWDQSYSIDARPYLIEGANTVKIEVIVAGGGEGYAYFEGTVGNGALNCTGGYCQTDAIGTQEVTTNYTYYTYHCANDINEYGETYEPANTGGENSTDPNPPADNCKREGFKCQESPDRKCAFVDNKWQCSPFPCITGNDITTTDTPVGLTDADNNGWDESGNCMGQIYIFNGQDNRCRSDDILFGLTGGGCCDKDKVFLGLVPCKEDEMKLAKLNQQDRCHYVGEYCSKDIDLIGCVQHKKSFCCFNSKLARIINEQGRPQIEKDWGSAKSPNCKGFTPDEFQKLDFSQIDMNEFFGEIQQNFNVNFMQNQQNFIQDRITNNMQNIGQ